MVEQLETVPSQSLHRMMRGRDNLGHGWPNETKYAQRYINTTLKSRVSDRSSFIRTTSPQSKSFHIIGLPK